MESRELSLIGKFMSLMLSGMKHLIYTFLPLGIIMLQGCGSHDVDVQLPADYENNIASNVISGSVVIGEVLGIETKGDIRIAHIEIDSDVASSLLMQGTVAWIETSSTNEFIELDATNATTNALGSDAVLIAKRRSSTDKIEQYTQRWARNGTIFTIAIAATVFLGLLFGMRSFLRSIGGLILIVFSLGMSVVIALLCNTVSADALVTYVYPHIGDGGQSFANEMGLPEGVVAGMANPKIVAFFVVGLIAFTFVTGILKRTTARGKG